MITKLKKEFSEYLLLMRNVPALVLTLFVVSVVGMNLLANKSITMPVNWLALDCGILLSWLSFLTMDILVKRFGAKAATEVSFTASAIYLILCLVFFVAGSIPGAWGESFIEVGGDIVNNALDNTFRGSWFVLFGSTIAFLGSSIINNFVNEGIGKYTKHHKDSFKCYAIRSYVSTMIGQFSDNLIFSLIVSYNFFGWSLLQCFMCSLTGAVVELLFEVVFSPIGFKVVNNWKKEKVGKKYLDTIANNH